MKDKVEATIGHTSVVSISDVLENKVGATIGHTSVVSISLRDARQSQSVGSRFAMPANHKDTLEE